MKACSTKILELFYNAKHSGRVMKPDAIGRVGEDGDGLVIELTWRVVEGVITDAKFRAFGNPNAIAITSLMTDNIIGKPIEEAMLINEDVITDNLDELRPEYIEAYDMVHMAMAEAYNNYLKRQNRKDNINKVEYASEYQDEFEQDEEIDIEQQIQTEIQGITEISTEKHGRGRPRKERPEGEEEIVTEKRGRGRPRKIVDESEIVEVGEKRGRGRPRKIVDENAIVEIGEKRGRGRPRKERPEGEELIVGEKRGRGRPRKIVDESEIVITEKRGRGRPRKERPEGEEIVTEKRGRGRPRKEVDETEVVEIGEKRGRGRPRKPVDENVMVEIGEKRGRGRPRKEVKYDFPSDLGEVINDEEVDQLINGNSVESNETNDFVDDLISNKLIDEDDDMFDADYDLFKSNIRNILSGKEVDSLNHYGETKLQSSNMEIKPKVEVEEIDLDEKDMIQPTIANEDVVDEKRGRGRPRKIVDESEIEEGEKRGRGRPRKIEIEEVEENTSSEPARQRIDTVSSLTRSLSSNGGVPSYNNTQDIVFASKNVTTTNININVTKTTTSVDDNQSVSDDYSKNINISRVKENSTISMPASEIEYGDEEIDVEPKTINNVEIEEDLEDEFDNHIEDDIDEDIDASHIKDEAPKGGIEDLLKALLNDD